MKKAFNLLLMLSAGALLASCSCGPNTSASSESAPIPQPASSEPSSQSKSEPSSASQSSEKSSEKSSESKPDSSDASVISSSESKPVESSSQPASEPASSESEPDGSSQDSEASSEEDKGELSDFYYLVGGFQGWSATVEDGNPVYKLDEQKDGKDLYYSIVNITDPSKGMKFVSIADGQVTWIPGGMGNDFMVDEAGEYKVYFVPEGGIEGWHEGMYSAERLGDAKEGGEGGSAVDPESITFALTGDFCSWASNVEEGAIAFAKMDEQKDGKDQYKAEFTGNGGLKAVSSSNSWYPDGMGNELVIEAVGDYVIYFVPEGGVEGWYEGVLFCAPAEGGSGEGSGASSSSSQAEGGDSSLTYYVTGSFCSWKTSAEEGAVALTKMDSQKEGKDQYHALVTLAADDGVKVSDGTNWFPSGEGNEWKVSEAGDYDVYFVAEGGIAEWSGSSGYFYVAAHSAE